MKLFGFTYLVSNGLYYTRNFLTFQEEELAYRGKVLSLDVPKDKLSTIGAGLVFPDATARHFWNEHKIHYSVAVISKKSIKKKTSTTDNSSQSSSSKSAGDYSAKQNTSTKKEKATSTESASTSSASNNKVTVSASTQSLSTGNGSGGGVAVAAKSETSASKTTDDVKETPC